MRANSLYTIVLATLAMAGNALAEERSSSTAGGARFEGKFFGGSGDVEYLRLLDIARRMFEPDPEFQNLAMLYTTHWNGLAEGPTWDAWWIQNSYGTTYAALPFLREPFVTFLQNSQDLWFDQMGDGKRVGAPRPMDWVAPDGALCDAARPGWVVYKQGDGRIGLHDWGMEFTAAGIVMQAELLLISRDPQAIARYLPKLERCAAFVESRRDPTNNLFLAGPAGNLLAPSYAGWKRPDGTYGQAYLAGLSVTYIAALDRLIELEKLAGRREKVKFYSRRRDDAKRGLALLTTDEGYFIRSLDPDGVKHGVFGASRHGYFEASPNHDAIAFRVVDDAQAEKIYRKIATIPGLRPHHFILPNYPSYDDMYEKAEGLWSFGTWVNGGHWSTCEARMILAYHRLGRFEDGRRSLKQLLTFAEDFRMDNPLVKFGSDVYQPNQPINITYDAFGPPAAFIRGLFEYLYRADTLTLIPHIPGTITELEQNFPIRFGAKQLFLSTTGCGLITGVRVNGRTWKRHDAKSVFLPYDKTPDTARIEILFGGGKPRKVAAAPSAPLLASPPISGASDFPALDGHGVQLRSFLDRLKAAGLVATYEGAHAGLALDAIATVHKRRQLLAANQLKRLPETSQTAADKSYEDSATRLCEGLANVLKTYKNSSETSRHKIYQYGEALLGQTELIQANDLSAWQSPTGEWQAVRDVHLNSTNDNQLALLPGGGVLVNGARGRTVDLMTKAEFGDAEVHVEFCISRHSNSGVYLMGRYEVQIYDSHGVSKDKYPGIECGGIYPRWTSERGEYEGHSPRVNASKPAGEWQSFDIRFRAPRFDPTGRKTSHARFERVVLNGQLVHENVEVTGPTRAARWENETVVAPLLLQGDHGPVAFRNVRIRPLPAR